MKKLFTAILSGSLLFLIYCIFAVNLSHYDYAMNSDIAGELLLSAEISETGQLLPDTWFSSTETRIISVPNLVAPIYSLTGNLILSAGIALNLFMILILLSAFYLAICFEIDQKSLLLTIFLTLVLSLPSGDTMLGVLFLSGGYYAIHTVLLFLTLGVFTRLRIDNEDKSILNKTMIILTAVFSFLLGLQGTRGLLVIYGPLFLLSLLLFAYDRFTKGISSYKHLIYSTLLLVLSYIGTRFPLSKHQELSRNIRKGFVKLFTIVIPSMGRSIGFSEASLLRKIILLILVLCVIFNLGMILRKLIKHEHITAVETTFIMFLLSPLMSGLAVAFTTFGNSDRYYFVLLFALAVSPILTLSYLHKQSYGIYAVILISILSVFLSVTDTYIPIMKGHVEYDEALKEVSAYMIENEYHNAVATFEKADTLAVMSNRYVTVSVVNGFEKMDATRWLSSMRWYPPYVDKNTPTVYVVSDVEMESFENSMTPLRNDFILLEKIGKYNLYYSEHNYSVN